MEIKHTIEILTKDIQDIEKLVRNFNNYPSPPKIEIDLAMAKLRNVYDLLSMIASDITVDLSRREDIEREIAEDRTRENDKAMNPDTDQVQHQPEENLASRPEIKEPEIVPKEEPKVVPKEEPEKDIVEESVPEIENNKPETPHSVEKHEAQKTAPPKDANEAQQEPKTKEEERKSAILAEKFKADKSINEKIASKSDEEKESVFSGEPIDSIRRNIGINDRFMIIRELLEGENEAYVQFIDELDHSASYSDAMVKIESKFPDEIEHDGVKILINLAKRKFLSKGNG